MNYSFDSRNNVDISTGCIFPQCILDKNLLPPQLLKLVVEFVKSRKMCVICSIIGKHSINSGSPHAQRRQIKIRGNPNVLYNFGNHQVFLKREDAKDELLKRYMNIFLNYKNFLKCSIHFTF